MSPLAFLVAALAICVIGVLLLQLRHREPSGTDHAIRSFQREMRALDPRLNRVRNDPFGRPYDESADMSSHVSTVAPVITPVEAPRIAEPASAAVDSLHQVDLSEAIDLGSVASRGETHDGTDDITLGFDEARG